jgi:hypothetical protein
MIKTRKLLHNIVPSLALISTVCAVRIVSTAKPASAADPAASMTAIMLNYNTAASKRLASLQADFNKNLPSGVSRIVYLDYDRIATWFGMREGPDTVEKAIGDYLVTKTEKNYDPATLSLLAKAMNSLDAEGILQQKAGGGNCLVVPEYPGISFDSFYAASFHIGQSDLLAGKTITIKMTTQEFSDFVNAHETWHCLDIRYMLDSGDGLEGAVKQNRAEMFADIGGVMEGVRKGRDLSLIDKAIALHTAWAFLTGPAHAQTSPDDPTHFQSIVYATGDGLAALKARIEKMGLERFCKLDREHLRAIDYEITDKYCLTYQQAQALQAYFATGRASAAALPLVVKMKAITAASVRNATPAELAASEKIAHEAANNGGMTEQSLLDELRARAHDLGDATSFPNQLRARQEMTDSLRARLLDDPASARVTEAQLKLLLYTDPRLLPRPGHNR